MVHRQNTLSFTSRRCIFCRHPISTYLSINTDLFTLTRAPNCEVAMFERKEFFEKDSFSKHIGIEVLDVGFGKAKVKMDIKPLHLNSHGTVHGGAIFSLADAAFALASNSHGTPAAAINAHISFMKSAKSGTLFADAEEYSLNPKLATYTVSITNADGERVAIFQGMVYRKIQHGN